MKGSDWNIYFRTLSAERRGELLNALETLNSDPQFCANFGDSFGELASIVKWPLVDEPNVVGQAKTAGQ